MKVRDFDLAQTLECGQCFNFEKIDNDEYLVAAFGRLLHVRQEGEELIFDCTEDEMEKIWIRYFDLERDYSEIKNAVIKADERLAPVVEKFGGVRILNQEFPETLISFIISQNKNIPQIKKIVRGLCDNFGKATACCGGREYHAFPSIETLKKMTEEDFRELKTGFRAPYICDAIIKFSEPGFNAHELSEMEFQAAKEKLMEIRGVGEKVANCVLLFSLGFRSAFPVDVWIKRIMEELYFGCDTPKPAIERFANEKFGEFGGYAQQYLFMYARERSIR